MAQFRRLFVCVLIGSLIPTASGEDHKAEFESHCRYVRSQAAAESDLLRIPTAAVGITQPETGLAKQFVAGFSESFSNLRKASLVERAAVANCDSYNAATEAREKLFFALPSIGKEVLQHRLSLIDQAMKQLDLLIDENMKYVAAQNLTRPSVYLLQAAKLRLIVDRTATLTGITSPFVPPQSDLPLRQLIAEKRSKDVTHQAALAKVERQSAWDFKVSAGIHQQIGQTNSPAGSPFGPYATVNVEYNLASHAIERNLSASVASYSKWQESEFDDVAHQASLLKLQIEETVDIQEHQLAELKKQAGAVDEQLVALAQLDSVAAMSFRNQLTADKIILEVNIGDAEFRAEAMRSYLRSNF